MTKLIDPCRNCANARKFKRSIPNINPEKGSVLSDGSNEKFLIYRGHALCPLKERC